MCLAHMVALDETALICDFAERYHVLDWRALPVKTAAALARGLGADSRIMRKISGAPADSATLLLAAIADALHLLVWQNTEAGVKGENRPKSLLKMLCGKDQDAESGEGFDTVEEFQAWRASMTGGKING